MKIDFVIPWVDCTDPNWLFDRYKYSNESGEIITPNQDKRYRDWGLLRFFSKCFFQRAMGWHYSFSDIWSFTRMA